MRNGAVKGVCRAVVLLENIERNESRQCAAQFGKQFLRQIDQRCVRTKDQHQLTRAVDARDEVREMVRAGHFVHMIGKVFKRARGRQSLQKAIAQRHDSAAVFRICADHDSSLRILANREFRLIARAIWIFTGDRFAHFGIRNAADAGKRIEHALTL